MNPHSLIIIFLVGLFVLPYARGFLGAAIADIRNARIKREREYRRTHIDPKRTPRIIVASEHRSWGDSIRFSNGRWVGWLTPLPQPGDEIHEQTVKGGIGRFIITRVDPCCDPPDMFFADAELMEYIKQPPASLSTTN